MTNIYWLSAGPIIRSDQFDLISIKLNRISMIFER